MTPAIAEDNGSAGARASSGRSPGRVANQRFQTVLDGAADGRRLTVVDAQLQRAATRGVAHHDHPLLVTRRDGHNLERQTEIRGNRVRQPFDVRRIHGSPRDPNRSDALEDPRPFYSLTRLDTD